MARKNSQGAQSHVNLTVVHHRAVHLALLAAGSIHSVQGGRISGQRQGTVNAIALNHRFRSGDINRLGNEAAQPLQRGAHRTVTGTGCRQRTVQIDMHAGHAVQQTFINQLRHETVRSTHGTHGVGTGGTNTNTEQLKNADVVGKGFRLFLGAAGGALINRHVLSFEVIAPCGAQSRGISVTENYPARYST